ncbi:hypothetical protein BJ875DRAFT_472033 [Amylocarpus encephaloides]|uniref:Uncharacterized protein n=1 Tax=Amylocarpus encephaloides TaxID=45428 RepID=A0A9P7YCJ7_9HELO|nr:hypothetical protein BJ875DRAFT_472033 [Amylocarpus encephaloides]
MQVPLCAIYSFLRIVCSCFRPLYQLIGHFPYRAQLTLMWLLHIPLGTNCFFQLSSAHLCIILVQLDIHFSYYNTTLISICHMTVCLPLARSKQSSYPLILRDVVIFPFSSPPPPS